MKKITQLQNTLYLILENMKNKKNIILILYLISLLPIFLLAHFNYMSGDDFGFGSYAHQGYLNGGFLSMIKAVLVSVKDFYLNWQGTYSAIFMFSINPAFINENLYFFTTYFLVIFFIFSNYLFLNTILKKYLDNYKIFIIFIISTFIQIQYVHNLNSSFYWYNGSVYYTFFYSLELILYALIYKYYFDNKDILKYLIIVLSIFFVGGNFVSTLNYLIILFLLCLYFVYKKQDFKFIVILLIVSTFFFGVSVFAPGNKVRQLYYISESVTPLKSILYSYKNAFMYFKLLNKGSIIFSIAIINYLLKDFKVRLNLKLLIFLTFIIFSVYAALFTPPIYAMGIFNLWDRIINIIYFKLYLFIILITFLWINYFKLKFKPVFLKYFILFFMVFNIIEFEHSSFFKSLNPLINGQAFIYREENLERIKLLNDENLKVVTLKPFRVKIEALYFMDIYDDEEDWIIKQIEDYYLKEVKKVN